MKGFILSVLILTMIGNCYADTFGCFAGVLAAGTKKNTELDYKNFKLYTETKYTNDFLPFVGCGISFDF